MWELIKNWMGFLFMRREDVIDVARKGGRYYADHSQFGRKDIYDHSWN